MTKPDKMSSRDRMLAVLHHQEADHVPLMLHPGGFSPPAHLGLPWAEDQLSQARCWLAMGLDAWLGIGPPLIHHPDVKVRQWVENVRGEPYPCMIKEYDTPAGVYRQEVYETQDWMSREWLPHGQTRTVDLLDDYNVVRYRRCPIQDERDIEKLKFLYRPLPDEAVPAFREVARAVARQATDLGVLLIGQASAGTDAAMWLCGGENLLNMAIDQPGLFEALLDVIHARCQRNVELLLDSPVDLVFRRGYYEGTTFWSPAMYRRFFMPRIAELARMVHQRGRKLAYTMSVGYLPLLDTFVEMGIDAHYLLDPIAGGAPVDLGKVKAAYHGKISVMGALNEPITLQRGTPEQIRQEVHRAVRQFGPRGLALTPAEAIFNHTPWESIEVLMTAWREARRGCA